MFMCSSTKLDTLTLIFDTSDKLGLSKVVIAHLVSICEVLLVTWQIYDVRALYVQDLPDFVGIFHYCTNYQIVPNMKCCLFQQAFDIF